MGKKGICRSELHSFDIGFLQGIDVLLVNIIIFILKPEKLQCQFFKSCLRNRENFIFPLTSHSLVLLQKVLYLFTFNCVTMKTIPAIFVFSLAILLIACGKDKFETKPKLEIKDYNTKEVFPDQEFRIRINYFDKEGDINGAPVFGDITRLNMFPFGPDQDKVDTFRTQCCLISIKR